MPKIQAILNEKNHEIDKKMSFFFGLMCAKLDKEPQEIDGFYETFITEYHKTYSSNKKTIKMIQEEEEKEFLMSKEPKENYFEKFKRFLPFQKKNVEENEKNEEDENLKKNDKLLLHAEIEENIEGVATIKPIEIRNQINVFDKDTVCNICLTELFDGQIHLMEICPHIFHQNCLKEYVITEIDTNKTFPIKCPDETCAKTFSQQDLKALLPVEKLEKYYNVSLEKYIDFEAKDVSWCPSPGCKYAFIKPSIENPDFLCPLCSNRYCLNCRTLYHIGLNCQEYIRTKKLDTDDQEFVKFVKGQKFKQCTNCNYWVEKTLGCDHMHCRCGYDFCYKCGGPHKHCQCKGDSCNIF